METQTCTFCQHEITDTPRPGNINDHTEGAMFCNGLCERDFFDMWDERDSNPYYMLEGYIDG